MGGSTKTDAISRVVVEFHHKNPLGETRMANGGAPHATLRDFNTGAAPDAARTRGASLERSEVGLDFSNPNRSRRCSGAQGRNRTTDTRIFSPLLYQLSYLGAGRASAYRE